jgi:hypothetical protein
MRLFLRYLVFAALLSRGYMCFAQAVTIRVVNADNGRPLRDQQVNVSLLYQGGEAVPEKYDAHLSFHTDANGEVRFVLPHPAPGHLSAQVELNPAHWHCACGSLASTEELVSNGIVSQMPPGRQGKSAVPTTATPAQILFFARPLSFWQRLLYPLAKG